MLIRNQTMEEFRHQLLVLKQLFHCLNPGDQPHALGMLRDSMGEFQGAVRYQLASDAMRTIHSVAETLIQETYGIQSNEMLCQPLVATPGPGPGPSWGAHEDSIASPKYLSVDAGDGGDLLTNALYDTLRRNEDDSLVSHHSHMSLIAGSHPIPLASSIPAISSANLASTSNHHTSSSVSIVDPSRQQLRTHVDPSTSHQLRDQGHVLRDLDHQLRDQGHGLRDSEHQLRDQGHVLRDSGHQLRDQGHVLRDSEHQLRGQGHTLRDSEHLLGGQGHVLKDQSHVLRDSEHQVRDHGPVMRDPGNQLRDQGHQLRSRHSLEPQTHRTDLPIPLSTISLQNSASAVGIEEPVFTRLVTPAPPESVDPLPVSADADEDDGMSARPVSVEIVPAEVEMDESVSNGLAIAATNLNSQSPTGFADTQQVSNSIQKDSMGIPSIPHTGHNGCSSHLLSPLSPVSSGTSSISPSNFKSELNEAGGLPTELEVRKEFEGEDITVERVPGSHTISRSYAGDPAQSPSVSDIQCDNSNSWMSDTHQETPGGETANSIRSLSRTSSDSTGKRKGRPPKALPKIYPCQKCDYVAKHRQNLYRHKKNQHEHASGPEIVTTILFSCQLCGKDYKTKSSLNEHQLYAHQEENKKLDCILCGKKFVHNRDLNRHMRFCHSPVRTYSCTSCDKCYFTPQHLQRHVRKAHSSSCTNSVTGTQE